MRRSFSRLRSSGAIAIVASVAACNMMSGANDFGLAAEEPSSVEPEPAEESIDASPADTSPPDASPPDTTEPAPDVDGGAGTKLVFVTTRQFRGSFGGIGGADLACHEAARDANIRAPGWRAWVSVGNVDAIDRITHDGPYALRDGTVVVNSKAELAAGKLLSPIYRLANGQPAPTGPEDVRVWTGTSADGKGAGPDTCLGWTSENFIDFGVLGYLVASDASWTRAPGAVQTAGGWGCQTLARLYCFER